MENEFDEKLLKLIKNCGMEEKTGVPAHIIHQIMLSSFSNYCTIFNNLEEFYMQIEEEKRRNFEAETANLKEEEPDHELPPNSD